MLRRDWYAMEDVRTVACLLTRYFDGIMLLTLLCLSAVGVSFDAAPSPHLAGKVTVRAAWDAMIVAEKAHCPQNICAKCCHIGIAQSM
jgi:hypothetical protein